MKSKNILINNFGYLTIILASLISVHLLYTISSENILINKLNENKKTGSLFSKLNYKNKKTVEISEDDFNDFSIVTKTYYCFGLLMKCGFAFFLGALISERRFIKFGKI